MPTRRQTLIIGTLTIFAVALASYGAWASLELRRYGRDNDELRARLHQSETMIEQLNAHLREKEVAVAELSQSKETLTKSVHQLEAGKPQREAAEAALNALKSLENTWRVGSDIFNLNRLNTEARSRVDEASDVLPKGKLRSNLESAIAHLENATRLNRQKNMERDEDMKSFYQAEIDSNILQASKLIQISTPLVKVLQKTPITE